MILPARLLEHCGGVCDTADMSDHLQTAKTSKVASIYADGTATGNPGRGGYGVVVIEDGNRRELSGGFRKTMNSRMELLAVIQGLQALTEPGQKVTVHSDSEYVATHFTNGTAAKWKRSGWVKSGGAPLTVNADLWDKLLILAAKHEVRIEWTYHCGKNRGSVRSYELAVAERQKQDLPVDEGYEKLKPPDDHEVLGWLK